jgi:hypothetical protein
MRGALSLNNTHRKSFCFKRLNLTKQIKQKQEVAYLSIFEKNP